MSGGIRLTRGWGLFALVVLGLMLIGLIAALITVRQVRAGLPSVESLRELQLSEPLRVYTRDGQLIGEFGTERRALMRYEELPPHLVEAFVAAEDERFFSHGGIDLFGLARAALNLALTGQKAQGGSTITMQLARNVFLSSEKTYTRKFRELAYAAKMKPGNGWSKEKILESYLNTIYFGRGAYGLQAASKAYFNVNAKDLKVEQAALLAGLVRGPSLYEPTTHLADATGRWNYVLDGMVQTGSLTQSERASMQYPKVYPQPAAAVETPGPNGLIKRQVMAELNKLNISEQQVRTEGLKITTTIDPKAQNAAVQADRLMTSAREEVAAQLDSPPQVGHQSGVDRVLADREHHRPDVELVTRSAGDAFGLLGQLFGDGGNRLLQRGGQVVGHLGQRLVVRRLGGGQRGHRLEVQMVIVIVADDHGVDRG